jgi:glycosyltransferase involved in cell wall biosynthesis
MLKPSTDSMKISIITPTYNSASTVEETLKSVLGQTYPNIEHIIIDGGSTDETLAIIDRYRSNIACVISEPDHGLYDAMNKGVARATGDVIGILNSDDLFFSSDVVASIAQIFVDPSVSACYGDLVYCSRRNSNVITRVWHAGVYRSWKLWFGWMPPHPTLYIRQSVYQDCGSYLLNLPVAADYEFMLRLFKKYGMSIRHIAKVFIVMRPGGNSSKNLRARIRGLTEGYRSWNINGMFPSPFLFMRIIMKLPQFLKRIQKKDF